MGKLIDETGKIYGKLLVLERDQTKKSKAAYWNCQCLECGKIISIKGESLRHRKNPTCGCIPNVGNNFKDITGQKFGKLTVLKRAENKNKIVYWLCQCECGNQKKIASSSLLNGRTKSCGLCLRNDAINEIGNKYGKLTVLERFIDKTYSFSSAKWKCKCDCGEEVVLAGNVLRRPDGPRACKSCGQKKNLINQRFGKLLVLQELPKNQYECKCDCGKKIITTGKNLLRGHKTSCGCIKSTGEKIISDILTKNNINFISQKSFDTCRNLKTNYLLFFDFYLPDFNVLIEYDGEQHYKDTNEYFKDSLKEIQIRDNIKTNWCIKNNITLIRIPYYHQNAITLEDLLPMSSRYIKEDLGVVE